jgi:tetratricopeptide (TPR) repeat protein
LSLRQRLALFVPVCQSVQHAHQNGIIHRDLKPSNVLVAEHDGRPVPKVIDFGVAKALHQPLTERTLVTEFGAVVGTLEYMSPEQADLSASGIDTRADLYTLGVLLYELLTGTTPLTRERLTRAGLEEVLRAIREEEPPKPSARLMDSAAALGDLAARRGTAPGRLAREVRGELDWIVMKCLEKDRTRRYETAGGLARDLQRYLGGEPVEAGPPGAGYRFRKFAGKHRAVLGMAAAVVALLVGATGVSTWQAVRATRAEARAVQERDEKEEQRQRADEQGAIATAVNDFLQNDLLRQADSQAQADRKFEPNPKLTVRELLDRAAKDIHARFPEKPLVAAAIREAIGGAYLGVGEYEQAVRHLSAAAEQRTTYLGRDHPDTLDALDNLAIAYLSAGRAVEAVQLLERVREQRTEKLGADHPWTLNTLGNLAEANRVAGRVAESVQLYERLRESMTRVLGPDHPRTLATLVNLAEAYRVVDRPAEAIPLFERVRKHWTQALGTDHPLTLTAVDHLALAYWAVGRADESVRLLEQVREQRTRVLGPDHPETLTALHYLASIYTAIGRSAEAIPLLERLREQRTEKLGPDHPDTLMTLHNLGTAYQNAGRTADAIRLYEQVRGHQIQTLSPDHPHTLFTLNALASAYCAAGRAAEAEPLLREGLAVREKKQPDDWATFYTKAMLGDCLARQQKYAEAEPLMLSGYQGMKQRADKIPVSLRFRLTEGLARLVLLYDVWGKNHEAAKWRKELEAAKVEAKKGNQATQP